MSYEDFGFDNNLSKRIEVPKMKQDESIHGREIAARTFPFVLPLYTTAERDAIGSPKKGQLIFNTTTLKVNFYNGSAWAAITSV